MRMTVTTRETRYGTEVRAEGPYDEVYSWYLAERNQIGPHDTITFTDGRNRPRELSPGEGFFPPSLAIARYGIHDPGLPPVEYRSPNHGDWA